MKLFFSMTFAGAFLLGLILAGPVAHAELADSVTCGKIISFEGDKARLKVGTSTYVIQKAHLPLHTKVPSEICLQAERLPANEVAETEDTKLPLLVAQPADGKKFVRLSKSEQTKMAEIARQQGIVFVGLRPVKVDDRPEAN